MLKRILTPSPLPKINWKYKLGHNHSDWILVGLKKPNFVC